MTHLRAIAGVLAWSCNWHAPGDDECFAADDLEAPAELVWAWAMRLPRRWWGVMA